MKQKCIHCDGLGYFYNQATFQSEHCPHCEGKGYIEINHDLGGPVETPAPKVTKKTTKTAVETPVEAPVEPQVSVDEQKQHIIDIMQADENDGLYDQSK